MPTFHLDIRTPEGLIPDEEGIDLPGLAEARAEAVRRARSIMGGDVLAGSLRLDQSIEIRDRSGMLVEVVRFQDALRIISDLPG